MRRAAQVITGLAGVFHLVVGVWAFAAPTSFFARIATFPPYNEHFVHDIGAFNLGLGAAAVAALLVSESLVAVLAGLAAGAVMHEIAHIMDRLLGGSPSDPYTLGALAVIVLAGLLAAARQVSRHGAPGRSSG